MSVARAQREISEREFQEWLAFAAIEPWGEARSDLRAGIIASTMANLWRGEDTEAFHPDDFMPDFTTGQESGEPEDVDDDAQILATQSFFEQMTGAVGGTIT